MKRARIAGSTWSAAIGFLVLTALEVVATLAHNAGLLDVAMTRRVIGILVGLMAVVTGNFLPKMRPLAGTGDAGNAASAERTSGWILVLLGAAFAAMFAFAPLDLARSATPILALSAMALIAVDWILVAREARSSGAPAAGVARIEGRGARRNVTAWLLFSLAYVLLMISLKMMADDAAARGLAIWSVVGFAGLQALFSVFLERRRRRSGSAARGMIARPIESSEELPRN